jgi:hypothetical protein
MALVVMFLKFTMNSKKDGVINVMKIGGKESGKEISILY